MARPGYFTAFENLAFERTGDGVLTVRFHTGGGPLVFTGRTHEQFPAALAAIADDRDNRVLVLTGTGDAFIDRIDAASFGDVTRPAHWEKIRQECTAILERLVSLPMPVIGAANGPATVHSEYLLLADVTVASEHATFGDVVHPAFRVVAGDGLQVLWEATVGLARARWLLWTGEVIDARTAYEWGAVAEIVPHHRLRQRVGELAADLAVKPTLYLRLQKAALAQRLRRLVSEGVAYGLALEGLTVADLAHQPAARPGRASGNEMFT
jgi:enoyl-CoA hydratase/carnithine racemase